MDDDDIPVTALVAAAADGDEAAWNEIVDRYSPLLAGILWQARLTGEEVKDVAQTVWLRLVEHLDDLREARALPMWIITTGRREAWRLLSSDRRTRPRDMSDSGWPLPAVLDPSDEELLRAERHHALLAGMAQLDSAQRELILLLIEDPPLTYAEISRRTGIPVGGIGPTRGRAIERLRRTQPIRALASDESCRVDRPATVKG